MTLKVLPINHRYLEGSNKYLISNVCGDIAFIDDEKDLSDLYLGRLDGFEEEKINELISKNILSSVDEVDRRISILTSRLARQWMNSLQGPSLFMVVPTLRCDHHCSYCQVSRVGLDKIEYDSKFKISDVVGFINAVSPSFPKIEFQGGEPMLMADYVMEFVEHSLAVMGEKNPSFVICSAMGSVDENFLQWAKDKPVSFSVSLDGPSFVHDKNRKSIYRSAHENTLKGISRIREIIGEDRVSCIATISRHSLLYPEQIVDHYFDMGFRRVFFRPLSPYGFAVSKGSIGYSADEYFEFYKKALGRIIEINDDFDFVDEMTLIYFSKFFRPGRQDYVDMKSPAGYIFGPLVVNYDGRIFGSDESRMIWEMTHEDSFVLGSISDGISIKSIYPSVELLSRTFNHCNPGCDECVYQSHCGTDPLHHLVTQGDVVGNKAFSFYCSLQRKIFDYLASSMEDKNLMGVFDKWLSL